MANKMFIYDSLYSSVFKCPCEFGDDDDIQTCERGTGTVDDGGADGGGGGGGDLGEDDTSDTVDVVPDSCEHSSLTIPISEIDAGTEDEFYSFMFSGSGGKKPYLWNLAGGSTLPGNLIFGSHTGLIFGTPYRSGEFTFIAEITDAEDCKFQKSFTLSIEEKEDDDIYNCGEGVGNSVEVVLHSDKVIERPVIKYPDEPSYSSDFKSYLCLYSPWAPWSRFSFWYSCAMHFRDWESMSKAFIFNKDTGVIYTEHYFTKRLTKLDDLPDIAAPEDCDVTMLIRIKDGDITYSLLKSSPFFITSTTQEEWVEDYHRVIDYEKEIGEYPTFP